METEAVTHFFNDSKGALIITTPQHWTVIELTGDKEHSTQGHSKLCHTPDEVLECIAQLTGQLD